MEQGQIFEEDGEYSPTPVSMKEDIVLEDGEREEDYQDVDFEYNKKPSNNINNNNYKDNYRDRYNNNKYNRDNSKDFREKDRYRDYNNNNDDRRDRDRNNSNREYYDKRERRRYDEVSENEPSRVVILRGLSCETSEEKISDSIKPFGIFESVSLKFDKLTGESRGFAFVTFSTIENATEFINNTANSLKIDSKDIMVNYSNSHANNNNNINNSSNNNNNKDNSLDWICDSCNKVNFTWRKICFNCNEPIPANPTFKSSVEELELPASSLILRDLDLNTTEEMLYTTYYNLCQLTPREIRMVKKSGLPKAIAFLEFNTLEEATEALNCSANLIIDNQLVRVNYVKSERPAKNKLAPGISASDYVQWTNSFANSSKNNNTSSKTSTPIPEGCIVDPATGYFYNTSSGYYYDNILQVYFYYDTTKNAYLYYNSTTQDYQPFTPNKPNVSSSAVASTASSTSNPDQVKKKAQSKINISSTIKKMDHEIDKWNQKGKILKEEMLKDEKLYKPAITTSLDIIEYTVQQHLKEQQYQQPNMPQSASDDLYNIMDQQQQQQQQSTTETKTPPITIAPIKFAMKVAAPVKVVAPVINKTAVLINQQIVEELSKPQPPPQQPTKADLIICKLCDRQFPSYDALDKHEKMSKLHQTNLENAIKNGIDISALTGKRPTPATTSTTNSSKEDNEKKRKGNDPFGENSIGYKLLKKSGWKVDEGIGKNGSSSSSTPIDFTIRPTGAGLGSTKADSKYSILPGDDYHTITRKRAMQRFLDEGGSEIENNPFFASSSSSSSSSSSKKK